MDFIIPFFEAISSSPGHQVFLLFFAVCLLVVPIAIIKDRKNSEQRFISQRNNARRLALIDSLSQK